MLTLRGRMARLCGFGKEFDRVEDFEGLADFRWREAAEGSESQSAGLVLRW